ncbi:271R [Invertebrate iridescent virus 6]|uniref:271R n=1 Tax=Invertebrate iridescent virus 6 TaxID=176652 RepID=Q91FQ2_IIV6|nr:271R [Invertebrate iridescent virus 6]AAK82132.1 271R [Invertebrate iridescent virus 6]QMS79380.1 hypothetical protein IIV6-T1_266 [Invertebrate iridescent virus 6]
MAFQLNVLVFVSFIKNIKKKSFVPIFKNYTTYKRSFYSRYFFTFVNFCKTIVMS